MNGLPKTSRLRLKSDFDLLFSGGRSLREHPVKAVYILQPATQGQEVSSEHLMAIGSPCAESQVAFVVPKKLFKKATDRNRVKRLMREAWRLNVHDLNSSLKKKGNCLKTLLIFTGKELPDYDTISSKIILILQRLLKQNEVAADQDSAGPDSHL
jgi:ribonuclease P protein component